MHFTGAKGTGMAALAEIFSARGAILSGSDVADVFYTDKILAEIGMKVSVGFSGDNVDDSVALLIYSAAYDPDKNAEILESRRRGLPVFNYPEALGELSRRYDSAGIAGVHGKTTTTAMVGTIAKALPLPATVLAGSSVASFGDRCTLLLGDEYFIAETCEYRRHFLNFSPTRIVVTSVESDHQDYYPTYENIRDAFTQYALSLPKGGTLIFCADDLGAEEVASTVKARRPDIHFLEYGFKAEGKWKIQSCESKEGTTSFRLGVSPLEFELHVPGIHLVLDAVAAIALVGDIFCARNNVSELPEAALCVASRALSEFKGSRRRSEIVGESEAVLFIDDYGHHPTAIRSTIEGIKKFWPDRRLVVDFMSHTYSRTIALAEEFASCFEKADSISMHKIYASAREDRSSDFNGFSLYKKVAAARPDLCQLLPDSETIRYLPESFLLYTEEPMDAADTLIRILRPGDIFLTMGAGDNWKLGAELLQRLRATGTR